MRRKSHLKVLAAIIVSGIGWGLVQLEGPSASEQETQQSAQHAAHVLPTITSKPEGSKTGYERDKFNVWASQPTAGSGCDTRAVLLEQESTTPVNKNSRCTVTAGSWNDPYSGKPVDSPRGVQVDHMIPLAQAWRSGANEWSPKLRERFANDLQHGNLVVANSHDNNEKSDQDPARWLPPHDQCGYAARYVHTYAYWSGQAHKEGHELSMDAVEHRALSKTLSRCS